MIKKRYLRQSVQMVLEMVAMLSLGLLCSISIIRVNLWSILLMAIPAALLTICGILLKRYGRYEDL